MMPASTNGGGQCMTPGPTDVCKTPSPAGPVPLPYPNIAMLNQADGGTCSDKVKIDGKKTAVKGTKISMSSGDEPGVTGGVVSSKFKGECELKLGSSSVKAEGKQIGVVTHGQGLWWLQVTLTGKEAHTGSTPMPKRRNAGLGMARVTELVHEVAMDYQPDAVGAIGQTTPP